MPNGTYKNETNIFQQKVRNAKYQTWDVSF